MRNIKVLSIAITLLMASLSSMAQITEIGLASFYADKFDGRVTASGAIFDQGKMTAAHRTFPFGTTVKVTNLKNKKSITVVINDRGPFVKDRVIDLSKAGAKKLDFISAGVAQVKVEVLSLGESSLKNKAAAQTKPAAETTRKKPVTKERETATTVTAVISEASPNSNFEYYKLESKLITPTGFGIQVASYQEAANLMKRCDEIKKTVSKDIIIQVGENNGSKVYRIIIGTFTTRHDAAEFNKTLKSNFSGSFVIGFK